MRMLSVGVVLANGICSSALAGTLSPVESRVAACALSAAGNHLKQGGVRRGMNEEIATSCYRQFKALEVETGQANAEAVLASTLVMLGQ